MIYCRRTRWLASRRHSDDVPLVDPGLHPTMSTLVCFQAQASLSIYLFDTSIYVPICTNIYNTGSHIQMNIYASNQEVTDGAKKIPQYPTIIPADSHFRGDQPGAFFFSTYPHLIFTIYIVCNYLDNNINCTFNIFILYSFFIYFVFFFILQFNKFYFFWAFLVFVQQMMALS